MTALVTGGAKRIGREIVLHLARRGHDVAIHCHASTDEAERTATEARAFGVRAEVFAADLLDLDQIEALIPRVTATMGPLRLLVNNASVFEQDSIHDASRGSWDRHMTSNLRAPFMLTQQFAAQAAPAQISEGEPLAQSLIVNMIDQRVQRPRPDFITYSLAKAGLWWLTQTTAQALAPAIRVNAIGPGPTLQGSRQDPEAFAQQRAATVLQRGASPTDICAALSYLLDARSVTGQMICVDGGQHLAWQTPDALVDE
ncbi:SDR family oxidoreductase [Paracoccus litorisediminis]|uniref:SDR family oxidoreductase n=1 Tax=Paracoccus litorisediminis TaxID=2006130 RepID=A0A844HK31_9RHOB|nr:SDR family oxidoreductase [Paracoccus litorisediminis]MTH58555.1 SDR family oxidoreductase [Paracoccus litorisediminis]